MQADVGPLTYGWLRPTVVIPQRLLSASSPDQLDPLLAHELIHIRRYDAIVGLLQVLVQFVWWFHPLVWWANRRMIYERERCCDEEVLAELHCPPGGYVRGLLSVAELKWQWRLLSALHAVSAAALWKSRIAHLISHGGPFRSRTPRIYWVVAALGLLLVLPGAELNGTHVRRAVAAEPVAAEVDKQSEQSPMIRIADAKTLSAASLIEALYDSQAWIDSARSFRRRENYTVTRTEESRRWQEKHTLHGPFDSNEPLQPMYQKIEWAWDSTRFRHRTENGNIGPEPDPKALFTDALWDGKLAINDSHSADQTQYVFGGSKSGDLTDWFEGDLDSPWAEPWGLTGGHRFWWFPMDIARYRTENYRNPEDFELMGIDDVNGRKCYAVQSRTAHYRMYIGVSDGRLYRRTVMFPSRYSQGFDPVKLAKQVGGSGIKNLQDWSKWLASLQPAEQSRAKRELALAEFEFVQPEHIDTFDDYREVAPGCWLPFLWIEDSYELDAPQSFPSGHMQVIVTEATVNQPLPDDLFRFEPKEGASVVTDWRYDPPIRYSYHQDQTEKERLALCEAEKKRIAESSGVMEKLKTVLNSRVGTAPPPLPTTGWLNCDPLTWEQLRGKVVMLHFWNINCPACNLQFPLVAGWGESSADNGIVVIGIHPPTDDLDAVRKKLEQYTKFPVLIDAPPEKEGGIGKVHNWFGNKWWPNTVLIDKHGKVAAHGDLLTGKLADKAHKLAAEGN